MLILFQNDFHRLLDWIGILKKILNYIFLPEEKKMAKNLKFPLCFLRNHMKLQVHWSPHFTITVIDFQIIYV